MVKEFEIVQFPSMARLLNICLGEGEITYIYMTGSYFNPLNIRADKVEAIPDEDGIRRRSKWAIEGVCGFEPSSVPGGRPFTAIWDVEKRKGNITITE